MPRGGGGVLGGRDVLDLGVAEVGCEVSVGLGGGLAAEPGVHDVPEGAEVVFAVFVSDAVQDSGGCFACAVGVMGFEEDADAGGACVVGGFGQPLDGCVVGVAGIGVVRSAGRAGEDADVAGSQVPCQDEELGEVGVVVRVCDSGVAGDGEDLDAGCRELGGDFLALGGVEIRVDVGFGVGAEFYAVVAGAGGQAGDLGDRHAGEA